MTDDTNDSDDDPNPPEIPPETYYEVIDPATGAIHFNRDDPDYRMLKHALMTAAFDTTSSCFCGTAHGYRQEVP